MRSEKEQLLETRFFEMNSDALCSFQANRVKFQSYLFTQKQ
jgi:hypothetical protein